MTELEKMAKFEAMMFVTDGFIVTGVAYPHRGGVLLTSDEIPESERNAAVFLTNRLNEGYEINHVVYAGEDNKYKYVMVLPCFPKNSCP